MRISTTRTLMAGAAAALLALAVAPAASAAPPMEEFVATFPKATTTDAKSTLRTYTRIAEKECRFERGMRVLSLRQAARRCVDDLLDKAVWEAGSLELAALRGDSYFRDYASAHPEVTATARSAPRAVLGAVERTSK